PGTLGVGCRQISRRWHWRRRSTAPHGDVTDTNFEITHPHHPLRGQRFKLVTYRHNWGEDRVYFHNVEGRLSSIPACWTTGRQRARTSLQCEAKRGSRVSVSIRWQCVPRPRSHSRPPSAGSIAAGSLANQVLRSASTSSARTAGILCDANG